MKDSKRMRPSDNPILQGDSSKFRRRSGWKPEIPLDKTLKDILEYWRKILQQDSKKYIINIYDF